MNGSGDRRGMVRIDVPGCSFRVPVPPCSRRPRANRNRAQPSRHRALVHAWRAEPAPMRIRAARFRQAQESRQPSPARRVHSRVQWTGDRRSRCSMMPTAPRPMRTKHFYESLTTRPASSPGRWNLSSG